MSKLKNKWHLYHYYNIKNKNIINKTLLYYNYVVELEKHNKNHNK